MTIETARKLLGQKSKNFSDAQIQELIDGLSVLADVFIEQSRLFWGLAKKEPIDEK